MSELTQAQAREWLDYDPATGVLTWKKGRREGKRAGKLNRHLGYRYTTLFNRSYCEHRVVWLWVHGKWPAEEIDHVNRIKDDNRIANLREATRSQNLVNKFRRSKSGLYGVFEVIDRPLAKPFRAEIRVECKTKYIGYFATAEEAHAAAAAAQRELYGEFAP